MYWRMSWLSSMIRMDVLWLLGSVKAVLGDWITCDVSVASCSTKPYGAGSKLKGSVWSMASNVTMNRLPSPTLLSTSMSPLLTLSTSSTTDSPMPTPSTFLCISKRLNRLKILTFCCAVNPGPVSLTSSWYLLLSINLAATSTLPSLGVYLMALDNRLPSTISMACSVVLMVASSFCSSVRVMFFSRAKGRNELTMASTWSAVL